MERNTSTAASTLETIDSAPRTDVSGKCAIEPRLLGYLSRACLLGLLIILFATGPAAAQADNPICADDSGTLVTIIEGFLKLTVALGVIGLILVWQLDSLVEMVTISREQKLAIKQHKRGAMKSAGTLVVIGPLFTVAGVLMGLPIAECVNLIPF